MAPHEHRNVLQERPPGIGRRFVATVVEFVRATQAATAVEFAFVAAPFIALLIAILELALVMIAQEVLQTATNQAARLIQTGQAQNSNMTASQFQQQVCNNASTLFTCSGIYVNVQTQSSFSSVSMTNPDQSGTFNSAKLGYSPGGSGDIEVVQVFYQWPVFPAPLGFNLSNMSNGKLLLVATAAFQNEPY
jgi:Flp pilus assembly protein TadG